MHPTARLNKIDSRQLAALRAVAETGSFAAAAEALGYTQSAISQQIATLEAAFDARLVDRPAGGRGATLTSAGTIVLRHADVILGELQNAAREVLAVSNGSGGELRVSSYQSVSARILPSVIARFRAEWPTVELEIHNALELDDRALSRQLERGEVDLAFAELPSPEGPFESIDLIADPWVLVVANHSPLAVRGEPFTPREIGELPLIGFKNCPHEPWLESQMRSDGAEPQWIFRSDDNATIQGLAATGAGIALVPGLTVDPSDPRTTTVPVSELIAARRIGIVWHAGRTRSAAADAFIDLVREAASTYMAGASPTTNATADAAGPAVVSGEVITTFRWDERSSPRSA